MKLSFIIPTYNSGKFLKKCLESVLVQTIEGCEVIVVDDGSTDDTSRIVAEFIDKILYIKKENSGVSDARNVGIQKSTGDYLCFVDADDYVSPQLSMCVSETLKTDTDILYFGYSEGRQDDFHFETSQPTSPNLIELEREKLLLNCLFKKEEYNDLSIRPAVVWAKVYKKKFIIDNNIKFESGMVLNEDVLFNVECLRKAQRVLYHPRELYYYRISSNNSGSIGEVNAGDKLLYSAFKMLEFANCYANPEVLERTFLRINTYSQRYLRKYVMKAYIDGYQNKRRRYFEYTNLPIYKNARKYININNLDFTGKIFYICEENQWFLPLYLREKAIGFKQELRKLING